MDSGYFEFFYCPQQEWAEWGVTQLQLSTVDFNNAPSQEMIQRGVAFIEEMNQNEKTVYVHCKAGRGRSTTLVACYLMKVFSLTTNTGVSISTDETRGLLCSEQSATFFPEKEAIIFKKCGEQKVNH